MILPLKINTSLWSHKTVTFGVVALSSFAFDIMRCRTCPYNTGRTAFACQKLSLSIIAAPQQALTPLIPPMSPLTPQPLGVSLPPQDAHALSVSMPDWAHVVGYEEARPEVLRAMACGYPRFFRHPLVVALTQRVQTQLFPGDDAAAWELMPVPTAAAAERLRRFLVASHPESVENGVKNGDVTVHVVENAVHVVRFPHRVGKTAAQFWQHSGEIVSSRHAEKLLQVLQGVKNVQIPALGGTSAHLALRKRVSGLYLPSEDPGKVALYPTGMAAIFATVRLLQKYRGSDCKGILVGFPYVDTLKILDRKEWCARGVHFFPTCGEKEMEEVEAIVAREKVLGIWTEFPGNPLLSMPDLKRLAKCAHDNGTVLVVDDTVGSYNVNTMKHGCADLVVTSLSKIFGGTGNVMAGSVVLNPDGPKFKDLEAIFDPEEDSFVVEDDAQALLEQSEDLAERLAKTNVTTAEIVQRLLKHPLVKEVFYPTLGDAKNLYDPFLNPSEEKDKPRYGPLFSILLLGGLEPAKAFYNALTVAKGPSLGTNFTLSCPYTLLAHYGELDFVESCGVDRHLIRISIGQEDIEVLWADFEAAFAAASAFIEPDLHKWRYSPFSSVWRFPRMTVSSEASLCNRSMVAGECNMTVCGGEPLAQLEGQTRKHAGSDARQSTTGVYVEKQTARQARDSDLKVKGRKVWMRAD
ncbi:unnamed protein product [Phytophthora fragariaefolia]|uniref:Unnamed protein product n=1 Tax=Phytophthora fragariaefolia TaxID=1490495 RepID=A0A9W6Y5W6_9STRA|nr:unnamed protein product [Phytophthora fragariaefolia]